jgi:hypothetical protein
MPATVPSSIRGKTLFVPVESATSGASSQPFTNARLVPSPPSVTTTAHPASRIRSAARVVSMALAVRGISTSAKLASASRRSNMSATMC